MSAKKPSVATTPAAVFSVRFHIPLLFPGHVKSALYTSKDAATLVLIENAVRVTFQGTTKIIPYANISEITLEETA